MLLGIGGVASLNIASFQDMVSRCLLIFFMIFGGGLLHCGDRRDVVGFSDWPQW